MGDGLLPLHLFARVTFNLAESYLLVEPQLTRAERGKATPP
jgi:hypothetical protein